MASGNNWHGLVGNLRKKGRFNRDKELVLFNPLNYRLSASFQTSHGSGPCCYHILLTTNVFGKKKCKVIEIKKIKKKFLLDQIYEQHRSKNSIERAKCDEIPNVKAADPSNVLWR